MPDAFDPSTVRALAQILADTGLTEIEIESGPGRIRLVRAVAVSPPAPVVMAASPVALAPPAAEAAVDDAANPDAVLSPMVGIVYLSPEPGAPPFVQLGQDVQAGQTVLLIEAMKTFNQIKAPKAGIVRRILVTPGAPVEYGEPLLIVE